MDKRESMAPGRDRPRVARYGAINGGSSRTGHDERNLKLISLSSVPVFAVWCIRFSQEPADQSVVLGERVVLSCVVFNYSGIVQWTKDGLALGIGEGLRGKGGGRNPVDGEREKRKEKKKKPRSLAELQGSK